MVWGCERRIKDRRREKGSRTARRTWSSLVKRRAAASCPVPYPSTSAPIQRGLLNGWQLTGLSVDQEHVTSRTKRNNNQKRPEFDLVVAALWRGILPLRTGAVRALGERLLAESEGWGLWYGAPGGSPCRRRDLSAEGGSVLLLLLAQDVRSRPAGGVAHQLAPSLAARSSRSHCCVPRRGTRSAR